MGERDPVLLIPLSQEKTAFFPGFPPLLKGGEGASAEEVLSSIKKPV